MNLLHAVVALIEEEGTGTVESLIPGCPGYSRKQIIRALSNAVHAGHIRRVDWKYGELGRMGVFAPATEENKPTKAPAFVIPKGANSVFALGSMA